MSAPVLRGKFRVTAFRVGIVAGFALPFLVKLWLGPQAYEPVFNVEVVSVGADVTRHGGSKVIVSNEQGAVAEQACREGCDDLRLQARSGDNSFRVRVLDAAGRILGEGGGYVTNGYGAPITRWTISGDDVLKVEPSYVDRRPDGTFEEKPLSFPPDPPAKAAGVRTP